MTNIYSWKKYNDNILKLVKKNVNYNLSSIFNAIENSYYPQTRDIFTLTANSRKITNILDFGSNLSLISNLSNRINIKKKKFYIFDPFSKGNNHIKIKDLSYKVFSNFSEIKKIKFDLIHFGSCIQYIENFYYYLNLLNLNAKSKILFTATPFNLIKKYTTRQTNHNNLNQIVHSYKILYNYLKLKQFDIVFKSSMNIKLAKLKTIKPNPYFLNILFQMK